MNKVTRKRGQRKPGVRLSAQAVASVEDLDARVKMIQAADPDGIEGGRGRPRGFWEGILGESRVSEPNQAPSERLGLDQSRVADHTLEGVKP